MGRLIDCQEVDVYNDDSFLDVFLRVQAKEQKMMIESLDLIKQGNTFNNNLENGKNYHRSVPWEIEKDLGSYFKDYKQQRGK